MQVALGRPPVFLALFDRVNLLRCKVAPLGCRGAGILEGNLGGRAKAHFPPSPVNRDAQHPLPAAIGAFDQPQPAAIRIFPGGLGLHFHSGQFVQRAGQFPSPLLSTPYI